MKYCGNCGKQLNDEDKICPYCSTEFVEYSSEKENQMQLEHKKNKKASKKVVIPIILVVIIIVVVFLNSSGFIADFKKGYNEAVSESQTTVENSTENTNENTTSPTTEVATETQTTIQNETATINVLDLFSGLEKAKEVLGKETAPVMDVEAYEQHTFGNVKILCIYGTNEIYKITVEYDSLESKSLYKFGEIDGNTTRSQWEEQLGETYYEGINEDEVCVYEYSKDFDGQNYYIIITATEDTPESISFIPM